jgi:primosomal protein N' (replication factor Y)
VRLPPAVDLLALVLAVLGASGPGLLVLVPSAGWAERLLGRLSRRGLAATGVADAAGWARAAAGWPVVVGSRAAAWAPRPQLSAAVVLDVHDEVYRSGWPAYDAGEVVAERARRAGVACVAVSPCPRAVQRPREVTWAPGRALETSGWPALVVVDQRGVDPRRSILSDELAAIGRRTLAAGRRFVCVLDRTGRARLLACAACGELVRCEHCGRRLVQEASALRCTSCGRERPAVCAACGATRLKALRPGVARVRQELEGVLGTAVGEVAGSSGRAGELPDEAVLVGTQAVLYRVRTAGAVAFVDFDLHLMAPRLGADEEAIGLLARAGRLVGGRGAPGPSRGSVLVQTRLADHPVLRAAVRGDPDAQRRHDLAQRAELGLPPFAALATLSGPGAPAFAVALGANVSVTPLEEGRWLARAPETQALCDALAEVPRPAESLRVVVDPDDV